MIIFIEGNPIPAARPKLCRKFFYDPQAKKKEDFGWKVMDKAKNNFPFAESVKVHMEFHMPIPKSFSRKKKESLIGVYHQKKPDISNLIKFVEDALNGILWMDDKLICFLSAKKFYSTSPGTLIHAELIDAKNK